MPSALYYLRYLQAGASSLEDYLLSNDLYWPVSASPPAGEPPYPRLTLSGLMLAQLKARALVDTPEQQAQLAELDERMDSIRSRWRVAWEKKAAAEFRSRLTLWRDFLEEYRENPRGNIDRYAYEVNRRVQLHLLEAEAGELPPSETEMLRALDQLLRAVFVPGEFVWEAALEESFPQPIYWFLYGRPKLD